MSTTQKLIEALNDAKGLLAHAGCPTYFIDTAIAAAKQEQQAEPDDDVSPLKDRALYALQTLQTDKHLPPTVRENMFDCVREAIQAAQPAPEVPAGCLWAVTKGGHTICQPPKNWGKQPAPEVPVDESIADEIALLRSVLLGYPQSFSRADALRALHRVSCAFGAVYTNPVPGEQK